MYPNKKPSTGPGVPTDVQAKEKLILYVYDYLMQNGAPKSANMFLNEIRWEKQVQINLTEPPGFLLSWWCVFWDLYCAAPERRDTMPSNEYSNEAKAFHDYGFMNSSGYQLPNMTPQSDPIQAPPVPPPQGAYFTGQPSTPQSTVIQASPYAQPPQQQTQRYPRPNFNQVSSPVPPPQPPPGINPALNRLTPPTGNNRLVAPPPPQYSSQTPQTPPQSRVPMSPAMQQRWPSGPGSVAPPYSSPSPAPYGAPSNTGNPSTPVIQSPQDTDMNTYGLMKQYSDHMISGNDMQQSGQTMDDTKNKDDYQANADFSHLMGNDGGADSDAILKLKASIQEEALAKRHDKSNDDTFTDQ
jgi:hypothetical protein